MKKLLSFTYFILFFATSYSQITVQIGYNPGRGIGVISSNVTGLTQSLNVASSLTTLDSFTFSSNAPIPSGQKLVVSCAGAVLNTAITANGDYTSGIKTYTFQENLIDKLIEVKFVNTTTGAILSTATSFTFVKDTPQQAATSQVVLRTNSIPSINSVLAGISGQYTKTKLGFVENKFAKAEDLEEENPVHIFFDQNGNNLLGTIPQGISNRQYIVHIIYPGYKDVEDDITYSVRQKTGSFNGSLNFLNNGIQDQLATKFQSNVEKRAFDTWHEKTFLLGIATDDLTFEIVATTFDDITKKPVSGVLQTYVIKMSPVYHGSFDVGLLNSELENPTYSLTASPTNSAEMIIKETDGGNRGVVTIMATFYTSPVILIEKLFEKRSNKKIPSYKLTGRNFLDDHKFYERIYPAIGVSISNKTFENLFFGLNWEIARGLSIFGGGHWGKVNTFDMPNYVDETTVVTQQQFDYYTNKKWQVAWAYGVKLDILIITNLFK